MGYVPPPPRWAFSSDEEYLRAVQSETDRIRARTEAVLAIALSLASLVAALVWGK